MKGEQRGASGASPQRQGPPLQRCAFVLRLLLLAVLGRLEAARVHVRVSLPGQLAVDIQQTVRHHRQPLIPTYEHLHREEEREGEGWED